MSAPLPRVQRPALLGLMCAIAFGAALAAGAGLMNLNAARLAGPVTLVTATGEVADALSDSPWVGSPANGPIVWAFTAPDCAACGKLTPAAIAALAEEEMEIRMIVVAPRGKGVAASDGAVAALAETRDWDELRRWTAGVAPTTAVPRDASVVEGNVEWGRASWDRIAAILRDNGVDPKLPLLIWKRGPEWRVLVASPAATLDAVRRDMAVES